LAMLVGIIVAVVCVATIVAVVLREWALLDARREPVGHSAISIEDLCKLCGAEGWERGQSGCLYSGPYTVVPGNPPRLLCRGSEVRPTTAEEGEERKTSSP